MKIIGRIDKADFPELELKNIKIKVDTGAFTSSIHSHDIREVDNNGEKHIEFKLLDDSYPQYQDQVVKVKHYKEKTIKNSFGTSEQRFIIETVIFIFGEEYPIELSLSERSDMKSPVLIGRKFLNHQFMVDTSQQNISYKEKRAKKKKKA